jgi:hypothetical protein
MVPGVPGTVSRRRYRILVLSMAASSPPPPPPPSSLRVLLSRPLASTRPAAGLGVPSEHRGQGAELGVPLRHVVGKGAELGVPLRHGGQGAGLGVLLG